MLNPIHFQNLLLAIEPIEDSVVADTQTAKSRKFLRHIREPMMNDLGSVFAEPDKASKDFAARLVIGPCEIGFGRGQND